MNTLSLMQTFVALISLFTVVNAGGESAEVSASSTPPSSSPGSAFPIYPCINVTDAFRAGSYAKSFCLVNTNLTYKDAEENCVRNGMKIYDPMPIEDPLFFYMNGNQQAYNQTEQVFIMKTEEFYAELNLYCMGYVLFRELYQKTSVDCDKPSYSFCEYIKTIIPSKPGIIVPTTPAPVRPSK